jgi:hypothetical protein
MGRSSNIKSIDANCFLMPKKTISSGTKWPFDSGFAILGVLWREGLPHTQLQNETHVGRDKTEAKPSRNRGAA